MYTIKLSDGTEIKNLKRPAGLFEAEREINYKIFDGNLRDVEISCDDNDRKADFFDDSILGRHKLMTLFVKKSSLKNYSIFGLFDVDPKDLKILELEGQVAYLSMMSDIDLSA